MKQDMPTLDLTLPQASVCDRHGEPFRKRWPLGVAQIAILAIDTIQTNTELGLEAGGDVKRIPALLLERPACERVERGRLLTMYVDSGIGLAGRCVVCGRDRLGTEYSRRVRGRFGRPKVVVDRHLCFECVLDRLAAA